MLKTPQRKESAEHMLKLQQTQETPQWKINYGLINAYLKFIIASQCVNDLSLLCNKCLKGYLESGIFSGFNMDNFSFDSFDDFFQDDSDAIKWSERDWAKYVRKSDLEISRFASLYSLNRPQGKTLEEIAQAAGWSLANYANPDADSYYASYSDMDDDDDEGGAEFSYEPWTLLNHPVFIITKALFRCLDEHMGRLLLEVGSSCAQTWGVAKSISEASNFLSLAVNSTDLGEDTLARCHYKMGAASLNRLLARVDSISVPQSKEGKERLARIRNIVFDLRQLCLNLAEQSAQTGGKHC